MFGRRPLSPALPWAMPRTILPVLLLFLLSVPALAHHATQEPPPPADPAGEPVAAPDTRTFPNIPSPNGLAINPLTQRLYVTSRSSNQVLMLDAQTGGILKQVAVGSLPWGIAVNPSNNRLYVANFNSGDVYVLDATTLTRVTIASLGSGAEPTFIGVHPDSGRVLVAGHGRNQLWVLAPDGVIEREVATGGNGTWGLAVHPYLKRVYVGHRDSANVITFDGNNSWQPIAGQNITPCGATGHPFALNFNPVNDRLYVACAPDQNVSQVKVYRATSGGLSLVASLAASSGGPDGGGGIAINTATNNIFFTNSTSRSVTVIGSNPDRVVATVQAGADPFGAVADPFTGNIFIGNRAANAITVLTDNAYGADATAPKLTLSRQDGCQGLQITVTGRNFPVTPPRGSGHVALRFNGVHLGTVAPNGQGSFSTTFTVPASRGGTSYVVAADLLTSWLQVGAPLRTPRTDGLPIIFIPGAGGSELRAEQTFTFWSGLTEQHTFFENSILWLDGWTVAANMTGDPSYMDALALDIDGASSHPDFYGGRPSRIKVGGPIRQVQVAWVVQDVYQGMINKLQSLGYLENVLLFYYPYDWRKDWSHTDSDLAAKIDAVLQTTHMDKVILMAHSTGGLVARNYLLHYGTAKVDQLITMGTPYLGSPLIAKYLEAGDDMKAHIQPSETWWLAQNFLGLYQLLPQPTWFTAADQDGVFPYYLVRSRVDANQGTVYETLNYADSEAFLASRHNRLLLEVSETVRESAVGNMSLLTDQYFNQRIMGTGIATPGMILFTPHQECAEHCGWFGGPCTIKCKDKREVPLPQLSLWGDDSVPETSARGSNRPAIDDRFYPVAGVNHGKLPLDATVQGWFVQMLAGRLCSNTQVSLDEASKAESPQVTGTQFTLFGDARLRFFDAQGRHTGPRPDSGFVVEYGIPGLSYVETRGAAVAMITSGGPYTVTVTGTQANDAALLQVTQMVNGVSQQSTVYTSIAISGTTAATLTIAGPGAMPAPLQVAYAPDWPIQTMPGATLTGDAANDVAAPTGALSLDLRTRTVTVAARDEADGSGLASILYSLETPPVNYQVYTGPFVLPPGAGSVWAVATDRAGNSGPVGQAHLRWFPILKRR